MFSAHEVFKAGTWSRAPAVQRAGVLSNLARDLEARDREWRADWDGDSEAAAAFRHEAWVIANAF